jgi:membrane associated rhomboid family serine protease
VGLLYRGKRERPLSRVERRDLIIQLSLATVGLLVMVTGLVVLAPAERPPSLGPALSSTGALIGLVGGYVGLRRHIRPQLRRLFLGGLAFAAAGAVIALVGYLGGW